MAQWTLMQVKRLECIWEMQCCICLLLQHPVFSLSKAKHCMIRLLEVFCLYIVVQCMLVLWVDPVMRTQCKHTDTACTVCSEPSVFFRLFRLLVLAAVLQFLWLCFLFRFNEAKKKKGACVRLYAAITLCRCFSSYDWWCVCPLSWKPCVATSVSNEVRQATRRHPQTNAQKHMANSTSLGYFPSPNEDLRMFLLPFRCYHNSFSHSLYHLWQL